ncbi:MAG TPA: hypothetical protein VNS31_02015, partial [Ramlibacter sp.]|nr:hypothetical protein [Ramlibacter sp.]
PNSGTATAKLTAVAVDANNNVVPGAAVSVATDANSTFTPDAPVTDAQGSFTGQIGIGGEQSDRTVLITVTVNGVVKQTSLAIVGSQLQLTATPSLLSPGGGGTLTVKLTSASSQVIAGKTVSISGDVPTLNGRQAVTNVNGIANFTFTAPAVAGNYLVKAAASGVTSELSVQVGTSAAIPDAVIPPGAQPSLAAIPNVVSPNVVGSTTNQTQLRFLFLDASNQPIPNARVRFSIASTGLGSSDSTISTGTTTVVTSASGVATAIFIPGSTGSPTDGVVVRACYQASEFTGPTQCGNSVEVHLTIAAQALAVSIGNDNLLAAGTGTYIKKFAVTVTDAAGRAVPNAPVDISLDITHYAKGDFASPNTFPLNIADANSYEPGDATTVPVAGSAGFRVSCINEDFNRNGFVDANENVNGSVDSFGQPTLEPRRSDIVLSYADPAVRTTNASGILQIQVEYSQRFATWLAYRVRATTNVAGSQGSAERAFVTTFIVGDLATGSFLTPPYGSSSCNSPN